jgi:hypothetical protein
MKIVTTANIYKINETQTFGKGFKKRELIAHINLESEHPQTVAFEAQKDRCAELDKFREGQDVRITFSINGREYNGRYYISLPILDIKPV